MVSCRGPRRQTTLSHRSAGTEARLRLPAKRVPDNPPLDERAFSLSGTGELTKPRYFRKGSLVNLRRKTASMRRQSGN